MRYLEFIKSKEVKRHPVGFNPIWMPDWLFPFQQELCMWSIRMGRAALFEDCGLGKTPQQLVWAENIVRKTNKKVLIVTPLAVSHQTLREAEKFHIQAKRSADGLAYKGITVTNYERLSRFNSSDFVGFVADESSILKNFDGKTRRHITEFITNIPYRLLCTATPAPNDFMELGTSSEALGIMTYNQMLAMFFTHDSNDTKQWEVKPHAKRRFWEWVSTWARAIRRPSDLGFDDGSFALPPLKYDQLRLDTSEPARGMLIVQPAIGMDEQRQERKNSLHPRCEAVAKIVAAKPKEAWVIWCHLNPEGDTLEKLIPGACQVSGSMSDDEKEERFIAFVTGKIKVLITKPRIGGFGMNWQHCHNITYFPDDSYEKFYQCIRRCWRFGQEHPVTCHIVSSYRQYRMVHNMLQKERQADDMYNGIIKNMTDFQLGVRKEKETASQKVKAPVWL